MYLYGKHASLAHCVHFSYIRCCDWVVIWRSGSLTVVDSINERNVGSEMNIIEMFY